VSGNSSWKSLKLERILVMSNTLREAAAAVLEALILSDGMHSYAKEIADLRAALAEPAIKPDLTTEPVAWAMPRPDGLILDVICPDEHEAYEGEYTVPLYAHPYDQQALELCEVCGWKTMIPTEGCLNCERQPKAEQEPGNWTVYNSGAEVASGLSFSEAWEYMTPERLARQWCAVCVLDKSNLPTAPQPRKRLTDQEIEDVFFDMGQFAKVDCENTRRAIVRAAAEIGKGMA
jgi:hypothetical protein